MSRLNGREPINCTKYKYLNTSNKGCACSFSAGQGRVGRVIAIEALKRGHQVTTFHRGSKPTPEGAISITGDRLNSDDYEGLSGLAFDAVIDTWQGHPAAVTNAWTALAGRFRYYAYVSSISVYQQPDSASLISRTEDTPLADVSQPEPNGYIVNKRLAEVIAEENGKQQGIPVLFARAGMIFGLGDYSPSSNRLFWWLNRMRRGGPVLAPGPRDNPIQFVDVRDLAEFLVNAAETRLAGSYTANGDIGATTMGELLEEANAVTGKHAELKWTSPEVILEAGIEPWTELPCWLPPNTVDHCSMYSWDVSKARAAGLKMRPVTDTVKDTWAWMQSGQQAESYDTVNWTIGLNSEKEAKVLGL
ncbi:reductase [Whalleya microplaca]|nr:reductase [Whalleya microplaca]